MPVNELPKMLAVVEENAGEVNFYHAATGDALGGLHVGFLPHEITITKDGKTAFVTNFGIRDYDSGLGIPGVSISVIDIENRLEKYRLFTFNPREKNAYDVIDSAPHGLALHPHNEKLLYVNVEKGHKILVFDVDTREIIKQFAVNPETHNLFFSEDGKALWLMAGTDGIIKMDAETGETLTSISLNTNLRGLKYTPNKKMLLASGVNQIFLLDAATLEIVKKFDQLGVGQIFYSTITKDQQYIIAPATLDNQVLIIDVTTNTILKRIVTGLNPLTALLSESEKSVYITNVTDFFVTEIDLITFATKKIATKEAPNGVALVQLQRKKNPRKLKMGVALPLSGTDAKYGRDMMRGYEYWRLLVSRAGGLAVENKAYEFDIIYLDTQSHLENQAALTNDLINKYEVTLLLTPYGDKSYEIVKQIAIDHKTVITPAQTNYTEWEPNNIARGLDYFVTSKFYVERYYAQYNFPASIYSATATAIGIALQQAVLRAQTLNYKQLTSAIRKKDFYLFHQI